MRGIINAHRSGPHRLACLALYRGLLRQATKLPDKTSSSHVIQLVRKRFQLDRTIVSPYVIVYALEQGRKAYDTICQAANGSKKAQAEVCNTLEQITALAHEQATLRTHQNSLRRPTSAQKAAKVAHLEKHRSKFWAARIPNPIPIAQRPVAQRKLPNPEKPRRIPVLTKTGGLPFLRYKAGAQSPKLSWVLRSHMKQDARRWDNVEKLKHEVEHGKLEDAWDAEMGKSLEEPEHLESGWTSNVTPVQGQLTRKIEERTRERRWRAKKLDEIVQGEKKLALQEKQERKAKRRAEMGFEADGVVRSSFRASSKA